MESAEKAAASKRMRLGANGTILTKTMVSMVHMSTVYATVHPHISAFSFWRPRNALTLNAFPIRLTRFVIGKLPLQCAGKRALPVGQGQSELPHFNRRAELPYIRMGRRQRSEDDRVVATRKFICSLSKLERLCAISKCRIRIGC